MLEMEAASIIKKKNTIKKSKMKKTIKNILCRPDRIIWPTATDEESSRVEEILSKYSINVPVYVKPHWSELKNIPKAERPKQPKLEKVDGLIFGICQCARTIPSGECVAVLLDNDIDPKLMVQHIIEACMAANVPVLSITNLKKITFNNFGFKTCCLGVKNGHMEELLDEVTKASKSQISESACKIETSITLDIEMKKDENIEQTNIDKGVENEIPFNYLYRTSTCRVFTPQCIEGESGKSRKWKDFAGQEFIKVSRNVDSTNKGSFKNMYIKRVTNNPNRLNRNKIQ